jgi:putative phosphotransacetylase
VSNRHLHLSQKDLEILFGEGYELTPIKDLGQPGQYAAEETVDLVGPKNTIKRVRVLGPTRKATQVEVSRTDAFKLGVNPPVRDSGDIEGSASIKLVGPNGEVELKEGVILAKRHIHMHTNDAEKYGLKDKEIVSVIAAKDGRKLIFQDVLVRVSDKYALEFHVDTDEANAAFLGNNDEIEIIEQF